MGSGLEDVAKWGNDVGVEYVAQREAVCESGEAKN